MKVLLLPLWLAIALVACTRGSSEQAGPPAAQASAPQPAAVRPATLRPPAPLQALTAPDSAREAQVDAQIDKVLGNHRAYRGVLARLQAAVAADDRSGVAALVRYPLDVQARLGKLHIDNAQDLIAHYGAVVTPSIARVITAQRYDNLFVSQNGIMLGAGQVWINGACRDPACVDVEVKVITFQQGG